MLLIFSGLDSVSPIEPDSNKKLFHRRDADAYMDVGGRATHGAVAENAEFYLFIMPTA